MTKPTAGESPEPPTDANARKNLPSRQEPRLTRNYVKSLEGSRGEKASATIEDIESKLDLYILPAVGRLPMAAVTEREIESLARSARHRSESTVKSILSVGSQFFAWGLRQRYCDHNPVKRAREIYGAPALRVEDAGGAYRR